MWPSMSHTLAPLNRLTSIEQKLKSTRVKQDTFKIIMPIVARDTLLTYLDLNETFKIHTNARKF